MRMALFMWGTLLSIIAVIAGLTEAATPIVSICLSLVGLIIICIGWAVSDIPD